MSGYDYKEQRPYVFSEDGQKQFLNIRDRAFKLIDKSGAATGEKITQGSTCGDTWQMQACIDRLVELGELTKIFDQAWLQYHVYTRGKVHNWNH